MEIPLSHRQGNDYFPYLKQQKMALDKAMIPYHKSFRQLSQVKSVADVVLFQRLEDLFVLSPQGFSRFLAPCDHPLYREGFSWTEELGFSVDEFRTAFSHLGIAYKSKTQFDEAPDKFQGKYFCSLYDRIAKTTFYYRNHSLVEGEKLLIGCHPNN